MEALKCAYDSLGSDSSDDVDDEKRSAGSTEELQIKRAKRQINSTNNASCFEPRELWRDQPYATNAQKKTLESGRSGHLNFQSNWRSTTTMEDWKAQQHVHASESDVQQAERNFHRKSSLAPNRTARQSVVTRNEDHSTVRRYIPKRERGKMTKDLMVPQFCGPHQYDKQHECEGSPELDVNQTELVTARNNLVSPNRPPRKVHLQLSGHTKGVNCVRWCPKRENLLLSASMDHSVHLWDIQEGQCLRKLTHHSAAVKDARWSSCGTKVLSCGYDKMARITDIQTGQELHHFLHKDYATCVQYHPSDPNLFLVGTFQSNILCWDSRTTEVVSKYSAFFGQVQDLAFLPEGEAFLSAAEVIRRNSADKGIMVWDFKSTAILSNQIYQEAFTCTCLRVHPCEPHFIAQSSGDYIAIFSTRRPYKLNKLKRYEGHKVSGYHIGCDFSPDGSIVASGSSDGNIYFYNQHTSKIIRTLSAHSLACADIAYHPSFPSTVASCSWDGTVVVWE